MTNNKFLSITIILIFILFISSCEKNTKKVYNLHFELNGGVCEHLPTEYSPQEELELPIPEKEYYVFDGWYDNSSFTGSKIEKIEKGTTGDKTFYAKFVSMFKHNTINFDGNGNKFVIKVLPVSEYDPFNALYRKPDKSIKQAIQKSVENAYNIKIEYSNWEDEAPFGLERINYIKKSFIDGSFLKNNVYAINIDSTFIKNLVKASCLAEIYNGTNNEELISEYNNSLSNIEKDLLVTSKKLYGISSGYYADTFIIYNRTKVKQYELDDPAELWYKGEWTWDKFDTWIEEASLKLTDNEKVLSISAYDYTIGKIHSLGKSIINKNRNSLSSITEIKDIFNELKVYEESNLYNKQSIITTISHEFLNNVDLLATGSLYNLNYLYSMSENEPDFQIGIVPYPYNNIDNLSFYHEPYSFIDGYGNSIKIDNPVKGRNDKPLMIDNKEIYGINLTNNTYKTPVRSSSCFAVMNYYDAPITTKAAANILNDLFNSSTKVSDIEIALEHLSISDLDKGILKSLQNQSLHSFEPVESIDIYLMGSGTSHSLSWYSMCYNIIYNDKDIEENLNFYKQQLG